MLHKYQHLINYNERLAVLEKQHPSLFQDPRWKEVAGLLEDFHAPDPRSVTLNIDSVVTFRSSESEKLQLELCALIEPILKALKPWRVGPFDLFGIELDAEWRSNLKWDRLQSGLATVRSKRVLDVGGNNGYFLYRMLDQAPELLMCLEPSVRCYWQFQLLQLLKPVPCMHFEPLGVEHLNLFPSFFDTILCMGVLYHRKDPLGSLQQLSDSLKPGGQCIIETLYIVGDETICLCPVDRYACMPNVWFLPTISTLSYWMERVGFEELQVLSTTETGSDEQRGTEYSHPVSLQDFLSSSDSAQTVEGYPRPRRVVISAWKRRQ